MSKRQGQVVSEPPPELEAQDLQWAKRCDGCDELVSNLKWYPGTALLVCGECYYRWQCEDRRRARRGRPEKRRRGV